MTATRYIPPATLRELANPAPAGQGLRHQQAVKIACSLAGNGHDAAAIGQLLTGTGLPAAEIDEIADWSTSQHFQPSLPTTNNPGNFSQTRQDDRLFQTPSDILKLAPKDCLSMVNSLLAGFSAGMDDIIKTSPTPIPTQPADMAKLLVKTLYRPDELLNIVTATIDDKPGNKGETTTAADWLTRFDSGIPAGANGGWLRMNPMTGPGIADTDVQSCRFCLIESDCIPLEQQAAFALKLKEVLPVAAIIATGGKSIHLWVAVNAPNAGEYRQTVKELLAMLEPYGVDQSNKNPSRLSRLPGAIRKGIPQSLLYLDPDAAIRRIELTDLRSLLGMQTDDEPTETATAETLPPALTLDQFAHGDDNGGNLLGNRFLCRAGGLLLAAPTGIGKSSWSLQAAVSWSLGMPHLGIRPAGQLRSLIIQAENDAGDVAELRDGIFRGLNLTSEQTADACQRVQIVCETSKTGNGFIALVDALVAKHCPDLLWIDPLFAYLGDDVCNQEAVSRFLRNGLNPVMQRNRCGLILVHHTNKPQKSTGNADYRAGDFAYMGSGTGELANWARAVIAIRNLGEHDVFEMILGKRGRRAELNDEYRQPVFSVFIHHSKTGICWNVGDAPTGTKQPGKTELLNLIPPTGDISQARLFNQAAEVGIGKNRCRDLLAELLEDDNIFEWLTDRSGTRPAKSYSRHRQSGDAERCSRRCSQPIIPAETSGTSTGGEQAGDVPTVVFPYRAVNISPSRPDTLPVNPFDVPDLKPEKVDDEPF